MRSLNIAMLLLAVAGAARAVPAADPDRQVWDDVARVAKKGPVDIPLLDEAVLHVPAGEIFVPQPQADRLLNLFGNPGNYPEVPGLLLPRDPKAHWYMPVRFHQVGHIEDAEARTWDVDAMLRLFKTGTAEQNEARAKAGEPQLDVIGWSEVPRYDADTHRLAWAITSRIVDAKSTDPVYVNYNTYALGRHGYFSMNMVTRLDELPALRPVAQQQIAALEYDPGRRYADFVPGTDRAAPFGLASLVTGADAVVAPASPVAALLPLLARFAVPLIAAVVVLVALLGWLSVRRRTATAAAAAAPRQAFAPTAAEAPASVAAVPSTLDIDLGEAPPPSHGA